MNSFPHRYLFQVKILIPSLVATLLLLLLATQASCRDEIVGFLVPSSGLGDQSFNDMTYSGLIQSKSEHDFALIREQCTDFTNASREEAMKRLITRNAHIIVVNGWEYLDLVRKYAEDNPERIFVINDYPLEGIPNVVSIIFDQHEGAFLAGALAAWMTQSDKIGFIGGMDMPVIRSFQAGFKAGAGYADPNVKITEVFLSTPADALSGFKNPELGFNRATEMYREGVDIIFSVAGLSGNGIIQAARNEQKFVIGVDADQDHMAKGYILTSVMKRLDRATYDILNRIFAGQSLQGVYSLGLKDGGISLTPMTYTRAMIPDDVHLKLNTVRQQIIDGEIVVPNPLIEPNLKEKETK